MPNSEPSFVYGADGSALFVPTVTAAATVPSTYRVAPVVPLVVGPIKAPLVVTPALGPVVSPLLPMVAYVIPLTPTDALTKGIVAVPVPQKGH
jgi:hypothetical protein